MVLYERGSDKYFADDLLTFLKEKKNDDVRRILEKYQPSEESLTISRLKDSSESTLLHYAAEYGNEEIVKQLIDLGSEIDVQDKLGRSPLILAVIGKHVMVIHVLLKAKADIRLTNVDGKSAYQMMLELRKEITETLDEHSLFREDGVTLYHVASFGNAKLIKWFLDQGCAVNESDAGNGLTALHFAVSMCNLEMVKVLIDHGADVDALDESKYTPLMCLNPRSNIHDDSNEYFEILSMLLSRMALLTASNSTGRMQISYLLLIECDKVVEQILKRIDNLFVSDESGTTIVHYMACNKDERVIELLRDRQFNVNARNNDGCTPLHLAVQANLPHSVKFLLENGADVYYLDDKGDSPLHGLFHTLKRKSNLRNLQKCIQLLLEYGSDPFDDNVGTIFNVVSTEYAEAASRLGHQKTKPKTILALMRPIIAVFVIKKSLKAQVFELVNTEIQRQPTWVEYFEMCKGQVDRMSKTTISGNVTLFRFLTQSNEKITNYARNEELVCKLEKLIEEFESNSPYLDLIRNRLAKAVQAAELKKNAVTAVCWLINLKNNAHYFAAENIVKYLGNDDMENLDSVKQLFYEVT